MENKNNIIINDDVLARYLAGEAGPEEAVALHEWLSDAANRGHFEKIHATWHGTYPAKKPGHVNIKIAWARVNWNIKKSPPAAKPSRMFYNNSFYLKVAASILLILTTGLVLYLMDDETIPEIVVSTADTTRQINFRDHSAVVLYHNSKLTYPEAFGDQSREVHLSEGEAFFNVAPDSTKPFIIHSDIADIKVVGTAFNVLVREGRLQVSVNEGRVIVYTVNDSAMLLAGFSGEVKRGLNTIDVKHAINPNDWGYATNVFIFKDTPLNEVIASMEKAYPYSIKAVNKNIKNCRLTATFEHVSAEKMLDLISETLNLSVTRDGKMFILEGEGCP